MAGILALKQAKERGKKIAITDVAIDKVVLTKLPGFSEDENRAIQEIHRGILKIAKEENQSNEVGAFIHLHTWEVNVILGTEVSVDLKTNPEIFAKMIMAGKNTYMFVHNHPSTGTFSAEDFKVFCRYSSLYMISVVGNDGSVYVFRKLAEFDEYAALLYYYNRVRHYESKKMIHTATLR